MIGVIIFARQFYGDVDVSPFGWSFALTIVGLLFFAINGCVLILLTVMIQMYVSKTQYQAVGQTRRGYAGFEGFLRACIPCMWNAAISVDRGISRFIKRHMCVYCMLL